MAVERSGKCVGGPLDGKRKVHLGDSFEVAEFPPMPIRISCDLAHGDIELIRHRYTWSGAWWRYNG